MSECALTLILFSCMMRKNKARKIMDKLPKKSPIKLVTAPEFEKAEEIFKLASVDVVLNLKHKERHLKN